MITKEQAFSIIRKEKPNHKITTSYEFPDKFAFVVMPKDADPDTFICTGTFVMKKDGSIKYGMPTVQEMEHAVPIKEENELKHHGVKGMSWGKRNGPPYPLDAEGKASLRKQRMESYGKSITKGGDYSGPSYDTVSANNTTENRVDVKQKKKRSLFNLGKKDKNKGNKESAISKKETATEEEIKQRKEKVIRDGNVQEAFRNREQYTDAELEAVKTRYILNQDIAFLAESDKQSGMHKVNSIAAKMETVNRLTNAVAVGAANLAKIYNVAAPLINQANGTNTLQQIPTGNLAQYQGGGGVPGGIPSGKKKKKK